MKNKSLYLSLSIFSAFFLGTVGANTSFAAIPSDKAKEAFSGFYITGSVGHSYLSAKKDSFCRSRAVHVSGGKDFFSNSFLGSLDIGREGFWGDAYLSLEGTVFHDGHKAKSETVLSIPAVPTVAFFETLHRQYGAGIKTRMGYQITDQSIAYGTLGIDCSQFSYSYKYNNINQKTSKMLLSITPGVGVKTKISDKLFLDFNYSYSFYQTFKRDISVNGADVSMKICPRVSMARVGFSIQL